MTNAIALRRIPIEKEVMVVALMARGDTKEEIFAQTGVNPYSYPKIRLRNHKALLAIKEKAAIKAVRTATAIKNRANLKLDNRLDHDDKIEATLEKVTQQYMDDEIDHKEYKAQTLRLKTLSVAELVNISKEMHNQSVTEDKPPASESDLKDLADAIKSGNPVEITKAVFNAQPERSPQASV